MALALSTYIGKGTRTNPFRPKLEGVSIDLRPDCTVPDGYALVNTEERVRGLKLGDDFKATFGTRVRNAVHNRLGVDVSRVKRFDVLAATLMMRPNGWNPLTPAGDRFEIWLGGLVWEFPLIQGGASDDFNRANETPLGAPWVRESGSTGTVNLSSNTVVSASDGDKIYYYPGAAITADQYSQFFTDTGSLDAGPACRVSGTGGLNGYMLNFGVDAYCKLVAGAFTTFTPLTAPGPNQVQRLEVEGSTLRGFFSGVPTDPPSTTDTSLAAAGNGVGFFLFSSPGGRFIDDWSGGDLVTAPQTPVLPRHAMGGGRW